MIATPTWYQDMEDAIEIIIERVCSLYPDAERRTVVSCVVRAIHRKANDADPSCAWLSIMLDSCGVSPGEAVDAGEPLPSYPHPSRGDAEDVAEDISMLPTPFGEASPTIAIRSGVHVAWERFASKLDSRGRALLAADALHYA